MKQWQSQDHPKKDNQFQLHFISFHHVQHVATLPTIFNLEFVVLFLLLKIYISCLLRLKKKHPLFEYSLDYSWVDSSSTKPKSQGTAFHCYSLSGNHHYAFLDLPLWPFGHQLLWSTIQSLCTSTVHFLHSWWSTRFPFFFQKKKKKGKEMQ